MRDKSLDDYKPDVTLDSHSEAGSAPTSGSCGKKCSSRPWCNSFVYSFQSSVCELHSLVFHSQVSKNASDGMATFTTHIDWCRREEGFTYDRVTGLCWKLMEERRKWLEANASCTAQGSSLITLDTTAKKDIVIRSMAVNPDSANTIYIGASRPVDMWDTAWPDGQHDFHWVTGQRLDTIVDREFWAEWEPNNHQLIQNVIGLRNNQDGGYLLDDMPGGYLRQYICEKRLP
ncbi:hypothetical protein BaRGS_00019448 [Batillaria attramentaria]|uniref:C-type lectin domain-containing protein n=1 Tax=Batillaria attramentaria TaxID=370345 RepID=A0ABD0KRH2_9CAEN